MKTVQNFIKSEIMFYTKYNDNYLFPAFLVNFSFLLSIYNLSAAEVVEKKSTLSESVAQPTTNMMGKG